MRPSVWGPILWNTMHIVSLGYPDTPTQEMQAAASSFYQSLSFLIPCPICRTHYAAHLKSTPPATESKTALVEWVWTIHNKVNLDIGKREVSFDAFMNHMESLSNGDRTLYWHWYFGISLFYVFTTLIFFSKIKNIFFPIQLHLSTGPSKSGIYPCIINFCRNHHCL